MKKKFLAYSLPAGLIIEGVYFIVNRFFTKIPDMVAYPMLIISIGLMVTGLIYHGSCLAKHKNPYKMK